MAKPASGIDTLESQFRAIYEPVIDDLEVVTKTLRDLAMDSPLAGGGTLLGHALTGGGKKVRPVVTLLASKLRPGSSEAPIIMAVAVELLHIATLIHDDTVDQADLRRGRTTISSVWGNDIAVLLGDYVFASSATFVCDTGNIRVIRRFSETIMELANGELAERFSTYNWNQTMDDYRSRIYNKTASLFCTAAESGGVLSGASESESKALRDYGYNVGMAYQITDDLLDYSGTEEELGKPVGSDLLQGTITLPALLFMERYPEDPDLARLRSGSREEADLRVFIDRVRDSSVLAEAAAINEGYFQAARRSLQGMAEGPALRSLAGLVDYMADRRS